MKSTSEILGSFLRGVRHLTGASSAAVFVKPPLDGSVEAILLEDGSGRPVSELRTLEGADGMAARLDAELSHATFSVAGEDELCWLVPLTAPVGALAEVHGDTEDSPRRRQTDGRHARQPRGWIGLRYEREPSDPSRLETPPLSISDAPPLWRWVAEFGAHLAEQAMHVRSTLRDPVTGLADRIGFQALLNDHVEGARDAGTPLSLALVNPHNFGQINERFGRRAGDRVIRELSELICRTLRESDSVSRYGGAIFGALFPATDIEDADRVVTKLVQAVREKTFLDGEVKLELCCGIAALDPEHETLTEPLDLIRRADYALNLARRRGEGAIERWQESTASDERVGSTRISEIFTGDLARDYRNMALLRDTVDMVAESHDIDTLAAEVVERLYSACKAERVGLFRCSDSGQPQLVRGIARPPSPVGARRVSFELEPNPSKLLADAIESAEVRSGVVSTADDSKQLAFAVPLLSAGQAIGAIYIDGAVESVDVDAADLIFFKALASQLSIALERIQFTRAEADRGTVALEAELLELRTAVKENRLVYSSPSMQELMATIERVGPTEATILITGESGTGKEPIARSLHEASPRGKRGLTVVDCGAIAPTLIDSELFGHDRGAYTGAQRRRSGRLAEADGGTVLLDEIGELPLEVQSRLLRFVQEKQITLVGESKPRRIDVRILAATNRDLEEESHAGRFRMDLFHRLNVVRLTVPPLRDRPEDIVELAEHFLNQFSTQYGKVGARLGSDALDAIRAYGWPGNVRELQNRILQAVILLEDREIHASALGLPGTRPTLVRRRSSQGADPRGTSMTESLAALRQALYQRISEVIDDDRNLQLPFGKWISEDLLLEADRAEVGIARRAARRLGLAETTYRRRLGQAAELVRAGLAPRPEGWSPVQEALTKLVHAPDRQGQPLMQLAETTLLEEIQQLLPHDEVMGAALLGVTLPTYRRRIRNLSKSASATGPHGSIARPGASH